MSDVTVTPGTIAVLKSGGPKMTVVSVSPTIPPTVKCTWFTEDASDVKVAEFALASLEFEEE